MFFFKAWNWVANFRYEWDSELKRPYLNKYLVNIGTTPTPNKIITQTNNHNEELNSAPHPSGGIFRTEADSEYTPQDSGYPRRNGALKPTGYSHSQSAIKGHADTVPSFLEFHFDLKKRRFPWIWACLSTYPPTYPVCVGSGLCTVPYRTAGLGYNEMVWDCMAWDGMGWDGMGWGCIK